MPSYKDSGIISMTAEAALVAFQLVKMNGAKVEKTAATADVAIGVMVDQSDAAADDIVAIKTLNADGTLIALADAAIAAGVLVYPSASGEVSATSTGAGASVGVTLTATTAAGQIEVLPLAIDPT